MRHPDIINEIKNAAPQDLIRIGSNEFVVHEVSGYPIHECCRLQSRKTDFRFFVDSKKGISSSGDVIDFLLRYNLDEAHLSKEELFVYTEEPENISEDIGLDTIAKILNVCIDESYTSSTLPAHVHSNERQLIVIITENKYFVIAATLVWISGGNDYDGDLYTDWVSFADGVIYIENGQAEQIYHFSYDEEIQEWYIRTGL